MASLLLTGISRLLHALTKSRSPLPTPPTSPQHASSQTYEQLLTAALSPNHPLHIRHQLPNQLINDLLTPESQLINLSTGQIPESKHDLIFNVDDVSRLPSLVNPVSAVLNDCEWDSRLVQKGFDWTTSSTWFIPLDISLLSFDILDRHFRTISTLSSSDSRAVVLYPAREIVVDGLTLKSPFQDIHAFMKLSGLDVQSVHTLSELSDEQSSQYDQYMNNMNVAVVRPAPRVPPPSAIDNISEVTYTSNDISSQTPSTEFEDYLSSDRRLVRFELDISRLPPHLAVTGNQIVVIGSESCVGCWDPRHSKRMMGRIDVPGVLIADVSISMFTGDMEYKYAVVRGDDVIEWETGWNRCLTDDMKIARDEWRYT